MNVPIIRRSEEHTSELQSHLNLVCRLLLEKKTNTMKTLMHLHDKKRTMVQSENGCNTKARCVMALDEQICGVAEHATLDVFFFFFNDTATTETYTLPLPDALPI